MGNTDSTLALDCSTPSVATLATVLAIDVLMPKEFELVAVGGSEKLVLYRTRVDALGREEKYGYVEIYSQEVDSRDLGKLTRVENPSNLSLAYRIGRAEIPLRQGETMYLIAVSSGDKAVFMQSRVPIQPKQLIDCMLFSQ